MFWIFAILLVLVIIGVLILGLRGVGRARETAETTDASHAFFRDQLDGIDADLAAGRLSESEATAARAELAREVIRYEKENPSPAKLGGGRAIVLAALPVVAAVSLGLYAWIGRADLPAMPLASRDLPAEAELDLEAAIATVEAQMVQTPDDVRGWLVLAPIYMEQGRFAEAANAWRRVLALEPPTADRQSSLAEALIMDNNGEPTDEALQLLRSAVAADPTHIRSRFYLAGVLTGTGEYQEAVSLWQELLALGTGEEAWIGTARAGLATAQAGIEGETLGDSEPDATMDVMIRGMVDGLAARLYDEGGTAEEWAQLVRSRLELDGEDAAREDLERALAALSGQDRVALEDFGREIGLTE
ncbi:c-type cytochrome biogenesis protein CcmI [Pelagibacterium sp. 26DY04]|uniref:c-type cytochrome biogenesis protein CcmI n=1 Tax=Pelagibacterium sp. 26DY04 TaxID=2967130 RepID=UPI0028160689|nr:c-type cytochrome biogenesis protein CcmI [Pelagibacterium sp. 26DY04]WMT88084.1 c-type cytochrome biogenesis protein CcmI [Pelagibacterium sp. 26DY04]